MTSDPVSQARLHIVLPDLARAWSKVRDKFFDMHGLQIRVTQGYRTYTDQWAIYAQGRKKDFKGQWIVVDKKKIVSQARGGESFHNFGLALDSAFMGDDPYLANSSDSKNLWNEYGKLCGQYGLEWGGTWKVPDRPHCQMTLGISLSELQMIHEKTGLKGVFAKCSQIQGCGKETTV